MGFHKVIKIHSAWVAIQIERVFHFCGQMNLSPLISQSQTILLQRWLLNISRITSMTLLSLTGYFYEEMYGFIRTCRSVNLNRLYANPKAKKAYCLLPSCLPRTEILKNRLRAVEIANALIIISHQQGST